MNSVWVQFAVFYKPNFIIIHSELASKSHRVSFHMTSASLRFANQQMHRYRCIKNMFVGTS